MVILPRCAAGEEVDCASAFSRHDEGVHAAFIAADDHMLDALKLVLVTDLAVVDGV